MCIDGLKECLMEEVQPNQCEHEEREENTAAVK